MADDLSVSEWLHERYEYCRMLSKGRTGEDLQGWLEDASYFVRAREAVRRLEEASADSHANVPIRTHIALKILRAWNSGTAGFSGDVVYSIHKWLDDGCKGPIPWIDSPFFADWAEKNGLANVGGYIGFKFTANLSTEDGVVR